MSAGDTTPGRAATSYEDFFNSECIWWKRMVVASGETEAKPMYLTRHPGAEDHHGQLTPAHVVTEHEDGTITVSPSILCRTCGWHGYLERGVWREV